MNPEGHQGEYFIGRGERQYGPYQFYVLVEAARQDLIKKADLIWRPGWDEWRPAAYVDGLFPLSAFDGSATHPQRSPAAIDQPEAASPNEKAAVSAHEKIAVGPQVAQHKR